MRLALLVLAAVVFNFSAQGSRVRDGRKYTRPAGQPPPIEIPIALKDAYTREGTIPLLSLYVDDTLNGAPRRQAFSRRQMDGILATAAGMINQLTRLRDATAKAFPSFADFVANIPQKHWLLASMIEHKERIRGKRAVVFGSAHGLEESFLVALGAEEVTVLDYQPLEIDHPKIKTRMVQDARKQYCESPASASVYDVAVSMSAFDHDGLGRYGDPLSPDGDLLAMDEVRCFYLRQAASTASDDSVAPAAEAVVGADGVVVDSSASEPVMFFSVPVGPDAVVWNLHRRYGPLRLPLLLEGYRQLHAAAGWNETLLHREKVAATRGPSYEPVMVLAPEPLQPAAREDPVCQAVLRANCA